jgi:hypothetical protein
MSTYRVVVIGGYGFFGRRLVQRLARLPGLHLVVCGRSEPQAQAWVQALQAEARAVLSARALDTQASSFASELAALQPDVTVHTSGPFQSQGHGVARACIACGSHYIDLADGRAFVEGIVALDPLARQAGLAVVSGASSVPALSSAAVDHLSRPYAELLEIDIGISPGNRTDRGLSTVQAILSYCGKPLPGGGASPTFGWVGTRRHTYPAPVGTRLLSPCDVPDLTLLPGRYPGTPRVRFGAGLELALLHRGMNAMAMLARWGWVSDWSAHAPWLKRMADGFKGWGSDAGAMHVTVTGRLASGQLRSDTWHLLATHGDGPCVPTLAAAALVKKLQGAQLALAGASPCVGLLTLDDFARECDGLSIAMESAVQ